MKQKYQTMAHAQYNNKRRGGEGGSLQHGNKHMNNDIGVLQNKNTPPPRHTNKTTHTYLLPTKRKTLASRKLTDDEENSLIDTQRISIFHQKGILLVITISARIKKPQHLRHTHTHT